MASNPIDKYAHLGLICGGAASTFQAAIHDDRAVMVLLAALVGTLSGAVVGALYGYVILRRAAR